MAVCLTSCLTRRGPPLRAFVRQQIMTRFAKPHTSRRPARRAAGSGAIRSVAEVMAMMVVMAAAAVAGAVVAVMLRRPLTRRDGFALGPWQRDGILRSKIAFPISQKTSSTTLSTNTGPFLVWLWVGGGNKRQTAPRQGESSNKA